MESKYWSTRLLPSPFRMPTFTPSNNNDMPTTPTAAQPATMAQTMIPDNAHKDIPGNPSTATSSKIHLRRTLDGPPLKVLTEADWAFWQHNGYVIVKNAVPREQVAETARFL